jgi:hypothetical protein
MSWARSLTGWCARRWPTCSEVVGNILVKRDVVDEALADLPALDDGFEMLRSRIERVQDIVVLVPTRAARRLTHTVFERIFWRGARQGRRETPRSLLACCLLTRAGLPELLSRRSAPADVGRIAVERGHVIARSSERWGSARAKADDWPIDVL